MAGDARPFVLATIDRLGASQSARPTAWSAKFALNRWAGFRRAPSTGSPTKAPGASATARTMVLERTGPPADPFDLALSESDGGDPAVLLAVIVRRTAHYTAALDELRPEFDRLRPQLEPTAVAVFEHSLVRHDTEIAWHRRLLDVVEGFRADTTGDIR